VKSFHQAFGLCLTMTASAACGACNDDEPGHHPRPVEWSDSQPASTAASSASGPSDEAGPVTVDENAGIEVINERSDCEQLPGLVNRKITGATLNAAVTLHGTILLEGSNRFTGDIVRIEPGTTVLMAADSKLEIGGERTRLEALGTPERPVRFCSADARPGSWSSLIINSTVTSDSVLSNVVVGGGGREKAAVAVSSHLTISDLRILDSGADGLSVATDAAITGLTVERSKGTALVLTESGALARLAAVRAAQNGRDAAELRFDHVRGETLVTIKALGIPYVVPTSLEVWAPLAIEAGTEMRFGGKFFLGNAHDGELHINGTAANPVTLRGLSDAAGSWEGVYIGPSASAGSRLSHVRISQARQALVLRTAATLDHVSAIENENGVSVGAQGMSSLSTAIDVQRNTGSALAVHTNALPTLPAEVTMASNAHDWIDVVATQSGERWGVLRASGTIRALPFAYHVLEGISIESGADLTVEAGARFVMAPGSYVDIGAKFEDQVRVAFQGTAAKPIHFAGEVSRSGSWLGIVVGRRVLAGTAMQALVVRDAGKEGGAVIQLRADVPITDTTIANYVGRPIGAPDRSTVDYTLTNTLN